MADPEDTLVADLESNHPLSWNVVEQKIRKLTRASVGELTKEEARHLYHLELNASRHSGDSPDRLLKEARDILR